MTSLNTSLLKGFGATLIASAAVANLPTIHFLCKIKSSDNVWAMSLLDGDYFSEKLFLFSCIFYLALHTILKKVTNTEYIRKLEARLTKRPSIVTSTLHGCTMWLCSVLTLICVHYEYNNVLEIWYHYLIPHSMGYYLADMFWYALPKRDNVVVIHHILMIICHYPITSPLARHAASAGDEEWAIWLSAAGYACAEISVPVLNARWWLVAGEHIERKRRKAKCGFTGRTSVGLHVAASITFFIRVVAFSLLLIIQVLPRYEDYFQYNQLSAFAAIVIGHLGTLLISALWLWNILNIGYESMTGVVMQIEEEQKPFSYVSDVWQGYGLLDHLASQEAGFLVKIDKGEHPEESTDEAKRIMENAMKKAQRSWLWPVYCMSCFGFSSVGVALYIAHSAFECVDEDNIGFLLPWKIEAVHFVIQGFLTYQADVAMEFYSFKKSSKWYQADRLSATFLMAYNVSKIFYFLSESGPRQFSVLALAGAIYCYQREQHELKNKSKVLGLYGAMYWHTLWHLLGCCSCYIWLGLTCTTY